MALSDKEIECIKAEVLDKMTQCETVNFNTADVGIKKNLAANKDNLYAQEGLTFIRKFNQKMHDAVMKFLKMERDKLPNHPIVSDIPEYEKTPEDTDWISSLVWTKESKPRYCRDVVLSAERNVRQHQLDVASLEIQALFSDTTSERDKFFCSYHREVSFQIYDIQMKIIHKEYSKLMKSAFSENPCLEKFVLEVIKNGKPS